MCACAYVHVCVCDIYCVELVYLHGKCEEVNCVLSLSHTLRTYTCTELCRGGGEDHVGEAVGVYRVSS